MSSKNRFQIIEFKKSISTNLFQKIDFRQSISKNRSQKVSKSVYGSRRCELGCSAFRRFRHESVPDLMAHPSAHLVGPWAPAATERVATLINWHLDRFGISFAMLVSASAVFWSQCRHKKIMEPVDFRLCISPFCFRRGIAWAVAPNMVSVVSQRYARRA